MSRCPPPLGPMCWGGRSSTCRASSPTVSVLPRQESPRPERHERGVKQGAGPAGPGQQGGAAWGTQRQNWCGSGVRDRGVLGWEPVTSTAVGQFLCLGCPWSVGEQTGARERAVRDRGSCHLCHPRLCLGARVAAVFLCFPPEQSGCPVTSSLAFLLLQQETCWDLLGSFPPLFPRQECPLIQAPPSPGVQHSGGSRLHLWP